MFPRLCASDGLLSFRLSSSHGVHVAFYTCASHTHSNPPRYESKGQRSAPSICRKLVGLFGAELGTVPSKYRFSVTRVPSLKAGEGIPDIAHECPLPPHDLFPERQTGWRRLNRTVV